MYNLNEITKMRLLLCGIVSLLALCTANVVFGATEVGIVTHLSGLFYATHTDGSTKLISVKSKILEGDQLRTEADTYARVKFIDGGEIVLRPNTVFKVEKYSENDSKDGGGIIMSLFKGGMRSVTGLFGKLHPNSFQLKATDATIGIRGTHFGVLLCNNDCGNIKSANCDTKFDRKNLRLVGNNFRRVEFQVPANGLHTDTAMGTITVTNRAGTLVLPAGTFSYTAGPDTMPRLVPPSQGIQVTMPPSISSNGTTGKGIGDQKSNACVVK